LAVPGETVATAALTGEILMTFSARTAADSDGTPAAGL
jgi:hypothetical protein